jgi:hypothetical protein
MNINQLYPHKYANGEDLKGKPVKVTIARVSMEKMRPNPQSQEVEKPVLHVENGSKGIVLNKTLAVQIANILQADDTEDWMGKQVVLYPVPLIVAGQSRVGIRAKSA